MVVVLDNLANAAVEKNGTIETLVKAQSLLSGLKRSSVPNSSNLSVVYVTIYAKAKEDVYPTERLNKAAGHIFHFGLKVDPDFCLAPALEGSDRDPITSEDDLPDCSTEWQL